MTGPSLIIDKSRSRPAWARRRDWVLTALMWLLYLYLVREALGDMVDLVTESFEWVAGGQRPYLPAISRFLRTLQNYGIVILANGVILIAWALYNQLRFRGQADRRDIRASVSVADLAALYEVPAADVAIWQQSRILVMRHAPDGRLITVTARHPEDVGPVSVARPPRSVTR